ncbi:MAG TPA: type II toxin-antitoxin system MqsA family antitoxin [Usitatibacter sp.]
MESRVDVDTTCTECGGTQVHTDLVRSAFWEGERLVVVEGIPALVCASCGEQFYDDTTAVVLDLLRGAGFPADKARSEMSVPVFAFGDRLPKDVP